MTQYCVDCKAAFQVAEGEEWKTRCVRCFMRRKRAQEQADRVTWQQQAHEAEPAHQVLGRQAMRLVQDAYQQGWKAGHAAARAERTRAA